MKNLNYFTYSFFGQFLLRERAIDLADSNTVVVKYADFGNDGPKSYSFTNRP
jgi:hypothetical protein